ncbi:helix-turn-helix domain-containing protein [Streptomyces sp. NPDC048629]|uniref:helix-turn-helix domain-containing protein n=1 Tax=Streptomyces sp. NPDC048629 TaxID=3154824 RepID=UPI00342DF789
MTDDPVPPCLLRKRSRLTPDERNEARLWLAARYDNGQTIRDLELRTRRSYNLIRTLLLEAGVELRPARGHRR